MLAIARVYCNCCGISTLQRLPLAPLSKSRNALSCGSSLKPKWFLTNRLTPTGVVNLGIWPRMKEQKHYHDNTKISNHAGRPAYKPPNHWLSCTPADHKLFQMHCSTDSIILLSCKNTKQLLCLLLRSQSSSTILPLLESQHIYTVGVGCWSWFQHFYIQVIFYFPCKASSTVTIKSIGFEFCALHTARMRISAMTVGGVWCASVGHDSNWETSGWVCQALYWWVWSHPGFCGIKDPGYFTELVSEPYYTHNSDRRHRTQTMPLKCKSIACACQATCLHWTPATYIHVTTWVHQY